GRRSRSGAGSRSSSSPPAYPRRAGGSGRPRASPRRPAPPPPRDSSASSARASPGARRPSRASLRTAGPAPAPRRARSPREAGVSGGNRRAGSYTPPRGKLPARQRSSHGRLPRCRSSPADALLGGCVAGHAARIRPIEAAVDAAQLGGVELDAHRLRGPLEDEAPLQATVVRIGEAVAAHRELRVGAVAHESLSDLGMDSVHASPLLQVVAPVQRPCP